VALGFGRMRKGFGLSGRQLDEESSWQWGQSRRREVDVLRNVGRIEKVVELTFGRWQLRRMVVGRWSVEAGDIEDSM
jgi:hypothetical protein